MRKGPLPPFFNKPDLDPARAMLEAIDPHVFDAVALTTFMHSWSEARPGLTVKLLGTEMTMGFKVITRAVLSSALMAVCRFWDTGNDTSSFPNLARLLSGDGARNSIPENLHQDLDAILAEMDRFRQSDTLMALKVSRAEGFAHIVREARDRRTMGDAARPAVHREVYDTVALSKDLLERCHALLYGYGSRVDEWEAEHRTW